MKSSSSEHSPAGATPIGRGRSGTVFAVESADGRERIRKVFTGSGLANLVVVILTGAPNPYTWCRSAIASAYHLRRILGRLVRVWFGDQLRLPETVCYGWDEDFLAFALETERIRGGHVALRHPGAEARETELHELWHQIVPRLQVKLRAAGFDGLLWQAGLGNPVALNNFMVEIREDGSRRWAWIDLESGVPALFPANPMKLFTWYLPKSFRHRQPLFDHVDVEKLSGYVRHSKDRIVSCIGETEYEALLQDIRKLRRHARAWRSLPRMRRGLTHALLKRQITPADALRFRRHPLSWTFWILKKSLGDAASTVQEQIGKAIRRITHFPLRTVARLVLKFARSHRYRARLAQLLVLLRIREWVQRGQLSPSDAALYRSELRQESVATYLADFAVHLALKPVARLTTYVVVPLVTLLSGGSTADGALLFFLSMFFAGPVYRTLYTLGRVLMAFPLREERPWIALIFGVIPIVGTFAFPMQFLVSTGRGKRPLPQFMLCDAGGWSGTRLPIWGGADTLTEHLGNRIGAWVAGMPPAATNSAAKPAS